MSGNETLHEAIEQEWEVQTGGVVIRVFTLFVGGIIGGLGFQMMLANLSTLELAGWAFGIVGWGVILLWIAEASRDIIRGILRWEKQ